VQGEQSVWWWWCRQAWQAYTHTIEPIINHSLAHPQRRIEDPGPLADKGHLPPTQEQLAAPGQGHGLAQQREQEGRLAGALLCVGWFGVGGGWIVCLLVCLFVCLCVCLEWVDGGWIVSHVSRLVG